MNDIRTDTNKTMIESGVLDSIAFRPNTAFLARRLHIDPESRLYDEFQQMVTEARQIAKPKAAYRIGYVEGKDPDGVWINGIRFTSRVVRVNLEEVNRVFFYLATCGEELETWSNGISDMLYRYWADAIKESTLKSANRALVEHLRNKYQLARTSAMGPGSLQDWPLTQQRLLFDAMDGLNIQIGVKLTESLLMLPVKTISGIRFPSENRFESCQLCPRENCIGRRAAYDPFLYQQKFVG